MSDPPTMSEDLKLAERLDVPICGSSDKIALLTFLAAANKERAASAAAIRRLVGERDGAVASLGLLQGMYAVAKACEERLEDAVDAERRVRRQLETVLKCVETSGVSFKDERLGYVEVQIDKPVWDDSILEALAASAALDKQEAPA